MPSALSAPWPLLPGPEAYACTDGASTGSRGPGGYGVVIRWEGKTKEISGGEAEHDQPEDGACRLCRSGDYGRGIYGERLLRRFLPHQLHEEGLVQEGPK